VESRFGSCDESSNVLFLQLAGEDGRKCLRRKVMKSAKADMLIAHTRAVSECCNDWRLILEMCCVEALPVVRRAMR